MPTVALRAGRFWESRTAKVALPKRLKNWDHWHVDALGLSANWGLGGVPSWLSKSVGLRAQARVPLRAGRFWESRAFDEL